VWLALPQPAAWTPTACSARVLELCCEGASTSDVCAIATVLQVRTEVQASLPNETKAADTACCHAAAATAARRIQREYEQGSREHYSSN
jgi:hypothetical protein